MHRTHGHRDLDRDLAHAQRRHHVRRVHSESKRRGRRKPVRLIPESCFVIQCAYSVCVFSARTERAASAGESWVHRDRRCDCRPGDVTPSTSVGTVVDVDVGTGCAPGVRLSSSSGGHREASPSFRDTHRCRSGRDRSRPHPTDAAMSRAPHGSLWSPRERIDRERVAVRRVEPAGADGTPSKAIWMLSFTRSSSVGAFHAVAVIRMVAGAARQQTSTSGWCAPAPPWVPRTNAVAATATPTAPDTNFFIVVSYCWASP